MINKIKIQCKKIKKENKGSILLEVALLIAFFMALVIGMASINLQISSIENSGRSMNEVSDIATQMILDDNTITISSENILLDMVERRTNTPVEKVGIKIWQIQKNMITGNYVVISSHTMGGKAVSDLVSIVNAPNPNPGIEILGNTITLAPNQILLVVQIVTVYEGVPRGVRTPISNEFIGFSNIPVVSLPPAA